MPIPNSVMQTLACLIIDGVMDRFPRLKFGAIELGASWAPSWMQFMDSAAAAFVKNEERLVKLSARPSEIAQRQVRITPSSARGRHGWIIRNTGEEMMLFSSDFPHVEGGRNPLKRFNDHPGGSARPRGRAIRHRQRHRPDGGGPRAGPQAPRAPHRRVRLFRPAPGPPLSSVAGLSAVRAAVIFMAVVAAGALIWRFQDILCAPLMVAMLPAAFQIDSLAQDLNARFLRSRGCCAAFRPAR